MQPPNSPIVPDPLHRPLDQLEHLIESQFAPELPGPPPMPEEPEPQALLMAALESSIEGQNVSPAFAEPITEPSPEIQQPPASIVVSSRSPDPPALVESRERDWPVLMAPPAARPFFTHEGLDDRGYHPQLGGSTGIRADSAPLRRWCDERKELVTEEACFSCLVEGCSHESEQKSEKKAVEESEDDA